MTHPAAMLLKNGRTKILPFIFIVFYCAAISSFTYILTVELKVLILTLDS